MSHHHLNYLFNNNKLKPLYGKIGNKMKRKSISKIIVDETFKKTKDDLKRCNWAPDSPIDIREIYIEYHDLEWGRPVHDDNKLFEMLSLEGAQAGLSWSTILKKRKEYKEVFKDFNIEEVSRMTEEDIQKIFDEDINIVKHKGKINSVINNAKCVMKIQEEFESFDKYLWSFMPDNKPIINKFEKLSDIPSKTMISERMAKELKNKGFKFVGPTICYALMQAVGLVNDHIINCFCYEEINNEILKYQNKH